VGRRRYGDPAADGCFYDRVERDELLSPYFPGGVSEDHRAHVSIWWLSGGNEQDATGLAGDSLVLKGAVQEDAIDCVPSMIYPQDLFEGGTYFPRTFIPASDGDMKGAAAKLLDGKRHVVIKGKRRAFEGGVSGDDNYGRDGTWTAGWNVKWKLEFKLPRK